MKKLNLTLAALTFAAVGFAKDIKTVVFNTNPQMHCSSCENRIKNGLKFEKGVKDIKTDLTTKTVTIEYDADKTNTDKLVAAFAKIDYKATEASANANQAAAGEKKGGCCKNKSAEAAASEKKGGCCKNKSAEAAAGEKKGGCCKNKTAEAAAGEKKSCCKEKAAETAAAGDVVKFKASQIRCGGCANKVKKLLTAVEGVSNVDVDVTTKVVTVNYDKAKTSPAQMVESFKTINYTVEQLD